MHGKETKVIKRVDVCAKKHPILGHVRILASIGEDMGSFKGLYCVATSYGAFVPIGAEDIRTKLALALATNNRCYYSPTCIFQA